MNKQSLFPLDKTLLNAAGMLGFFPRQDGPLPIDQMGAFFTAPISWQSRSPAHGKRIAPFAGGVLIHSGHPNPGWKVLHRKAAKRWAASKIPVVVHILSGSTAETQKLVWALEECAGVSAIELGLPPFCPPEIAQRLVAAASGELPLIVQLPRENIFQIVAMLQNMEIEALSLAPPRGVLPVDEHTWLSGRLYGPAILPGTLALLSELAEQIHLPLIASGGVYAPDDVRACLNAGASAVQLDTVLWRGGYY